MGEPQGRWVSVDPVSNHAVVDGPPCWDLVAGQQTHNTRVPMVELHKTSCLGQPTSPPGGCDYRLQEVMKSLTDGMALKRWVMKEAPC